MDMKEMNELLRFCANEYERIECVSCSYSTNYSQSCGHECYNCLFKIHRVNNHDVHYDCERILHRYILKFQIRHASEMARWFSCVFKNKKIESPFLVCSLGCGPASELYSLFALARYLSIDEEKLIYKGFDLDAKWKVINDKEKESFNGKNVEFIYSDFFDFANNTTNHIDVLVLNYVLSDIMRYDKDEADSIIDKVYELIVSGTVENVIINDIALYYTDEQRKSAYVCMQKLEQKVRASQIKATITKWSFSEPKVSGIPLYGLKYPYNTTVFEYPQEITKYSPFLICDSISMIIRKS